MKKNVYKTIIASIILFSSMSTIAQDNQDGNRTISEQYTNKIINNNSGQSYSLGIRQKTQIVNYISTKYRINSTEAEQIVEQANIHGMNKNIEPTLIIAMIEHESAFQKNVISRQHAVGLMQIIARYHQNTIRQEVSNRSVNNNNLHDIKTNISIGTTILQQNINYHHNNITYALQRYNGNYKTKRYANAILQHKRNLDQIVNQQDI